MGASNRAAGAIEPANADLLIPDRRGAARAEPGRDIEDACFETVGPAGAGGRPFAADAGGGFKAGFGRRARSEPAGHELDFGEMPPGRGGPRRDRLGVFSAEPAPRTVSGPKALAGAAVAALGLCAFAAAAVWATSGLDTASQPQAARAFSAPEQPAAFPAVAPSPDPLTTASVPKPGRDHHGSGFTTPTPRPARIERAGSILMIRPQTN